jgi:hypothetical protein
MMKFKNSNGEWMSIPAFKGDPGKDGAIQYKAGDGIKIENDTITAEVTKDYIDDKLEDLGGMGFTPEIAESLPTENIDEKTIYMVPSENGNGDNVYEEWMYINNKWEMIGSTSVDLTNYYSKDEIDELMNGMMSDLIVPIVYDVPSNNPYWVSIGTSLEILFIDTVNDCHAKGYTDFIVRIIDASDSAIRYDTRVRISTSGTSKTITFTALPNFIRDNDGIVTRKFYGNFSYNGGYTYSSETGLFKHKATSGNAFALFNYSVSDGGGYARKSDVLTKTNGTSFTPSADYHPATKKYVDDSIVESNIVSIDVSGFWQTNFSSGSSTGYASSNESVKAGLEKIARLGAGICIIHLYNRYSSMLCVYSNTYNHSDGGGGAYYTGSYQTNSADVNGTKATVTTKYASDGTPQNLKISFDSNDGFVIKDNVLVKTNTTSYTPTANYHPATKKYVDDALANIPQGSGDAKGFYTYKVDLGNIGFAGEIDDYGWITHMVTDQCKTEINDLINKMLTDDIGQPLVVIENTNAEADLKSMLLFGFDCNYDPATMQNLDFTLHGVANYVGSATGSQMMKYENAVMFAGSGIVTDGVWDATVLAIAVTTQQSLTTDNTWEYTPTGDYNPATKKYVDDAIGAIGNLESDSKLDVHWVEMAGGRWVTASETGYDYDWHPTTNAPSNVEYFKKAIANTKYGSTILFKGYIGGFDEALFYSKYPLKTNWSSYVMHGFGLTQYGSLYYYTLTITVTWDGQVPTFSGVSEVKRYNCTGVKAKNVLVKANTTEYTPTSDYNPATKKYVDDAVAGASGGITSESDPVFKASEAYKITSTDTANWNNKVDINAVNNAINTTLSGKSYITSESDPTVPSWAKQPNKPTYTASEVGALPASTVIPTVPTKLSGFDDDLGTSPKHSHSQYLTAHQDISGKQNKVLYGIADPTSDIGAEGDIYIKYV